MRAYHMECVTLKSGRKQLLSLEVPGLAEKRPSLVSGDFIFVKLATEDETAEVAYQVCPKLRRPILVYEFHSPMTHRLYIMEQDSASCFPTSMKIFSGLNDCIYLYYCTGSF